MGNRVRVEISNGRPGRGGGGGGGGYRGGGGGGYGGRGGGSPRRYGRYSRLTLFTLVRSVLRMCLTLSGCGFCQASFVPLFEIHGTNFVPTISN